MAEQGNAGRGRVVGRGALLLAALQSRVRRGQPTISVIPLKDSTVPSSHIHTGGNIEASASSNAIWNQVQKIDESVKPIDHPRTNISHQFPQRTLRISEPFLYWFFPQERLEGSIKFLEIVHVKNPGSFYCNLTDVVSLLKNLMLNLASAYGEF